MLAIPKLRMRHLLHQLMERSRGQGFAWSYNPTSSSRFGQFNPIRNGTAHRLNWEVISILQNILRKENKDFLDEFDERC